ncbi:16S rRNA (guanine(966)-N(2))-methyltransferase RsmD [Protofrankia sp. BMG5.30]|uniref:16S rRNA (guanine(966)-N(2))-methyltransferase RsmD n=2 Tax=Protofrankia TaxID=2994361 RepID=UPI0009784151|nr:16S rRNA (guanine(966)-N(2))-methyltransferase RsmD [Protofrankia sp. BMG5.30]ONH36582.1 16S rRNA (guanine(966)-N(2))-methyltransferase RsmD [Protofrankia sp. BMG5.30]
MTRIIGGVARGRPIRVPPGGGTRPTSDRAREGLFNTLASLVELRGARFADLYAGSGAVGFEALSRGASHVLFVDRSAAAVRTLRANAATLGFTGVEILSQSVPRVVEIMPERAFDMVFLDPPYALSDSALTSVLAGLIAGAWLQPDGVCVVERSRRSGPPVWPDGIITIRNRAYGEGVLWYGSGS